MLNRVDKQNNVDDVLAEDINDIAHSVIELEKEVSQNVIDQTLLTGATTCTTKIDVKGRWK